MRAGGSSLSPIQRGASFKLESHQGMTGIPTLPHPSCGQCAAGVAADLSRAILDLTEGISTMLEAVPRRLRRHQGERLWDCGPLRGTLKRGCQLLQPDIPRFVGG